MRFAAPALIGTALAAAAGFYMLGRRLIDGHVADYATHWSRRPEEISEGALQYVALGDSAAQGVGASHVGAGYVPLVATRLAEATGREVVVTNLSVSGAVSDDVVRDQLPELASLTFTPDLVTMDIGANDVVFPGHDPETFARSMRAILPALPVGSFVADVPWFMIPGLDGQSRQMAARAVSLIAESGHHAVAIHEASRAIGRLGYLRYTSRDFFHPNDRGYASWADAFWEAIVDSGKLEQLQEASAAKAASVTP